MWGGAGWDRSLGRGDDLGLVRSPCPGPPIRSLPAGARSSMREGAPAPPSDPSAREVEGGSEGHVPATTRKRPPHDGRALLVIHRQVRDFGALLKAKMGTGSSSRRGSRVERSIHVGAIPLMGDRRPSGPCRARSVAMTPEQVRRGAVSTDFGSERGHPERWSPGHRAIRFGDEISRDEPTMTPEKVERLGLLRRDTSQHGSVEPRRAHGRPSIGEVTANEREIRIGGSKAALARCAAGPLGEAPPVVLTCSGMAHRSR